jgi:hypothetical protein
MTRRRKSNHPILGKASVGVRLHLHFRHARHKAGHDAFWVERSLAVIARSEATKQSSSSLDFWIASLRS